MATDLVAQIKGVKIDMTYMGFTVDPEVPLASSGSSCGSHEADRDPSAVRAGKCSHTARDAYARIPPGSLEAWPPTA